MKPKQKAKPIKLMYLHKGEQADFKITSLQNSIYFFLNCVFIVETADDQYRLVVIQNSRTLYDEIYPAISGAKIAFARLFQDRCSKNVKPDWSQWFYPIKSLIFEKINLPIMTPGPEGKPLEMYALFGVIQVQKPGLFIWLLLRSGAGGSGRELPCAIVYNRMTAQSTNDFFTAIIVNMFHRPKGGAFHPYLISGNSFAQESFSPFFPGINKLKEIDY